MLLQLLEALFVVVTVGLARPRWSLEFIYTVERVVVIILWGRARRRGAVVFWYWGRWLIHDVYSSRTPSLYGLGAGSLVDLRRYGLPAEPQPQEAIAAGVDLVTFSADKLLGGPQAGLIVGTKDAIAAVRANPLYRALRVDKVRLAALRATLLAWDQPDPQTQLPTLAQLLRPEAEIRRLAEALAPTVKARLGDDWSIEAVPPESQIGSGAQPTTRLPSAGLALTPRGAKGRALEHLAQTLRALPTPVLGRITQDAFVLDVRTLADAESLLAALGDHPLAP